MYILLQIRIFGEWLLLQEVNFNLCKYISNIERNWKL